MDNPENDAVQHAPAHPNSEHASPPSSSPSPPVRARTRGATGPRTAVGKTISSRNAAKFGFFSKNLFLDSSAKREYGHLLKDLIDEWQLVGCTEILLLEMLAWFAYQLRRVFRVREALIAQKSSSPARQVPMDPATQRNDGDSDKEPTAALNKLRERVEGQERRIKDQDFLGKLFEELVHPGADRELERAEDHLLRQFYRTKTELERLKRIRQGDKVMPPVLVQVERT